MDAHQDVAAKSMCGEGIPDFYAKEIIKNGVYCLDKTLDMLLKPIYSLANFCKPMSTYNY